MRTRYSLVVKSAGEYQMMTSRHYRKNIWICVFREDYPEIEGRRRKEEIHWRD